MSSVLIDSSEYDRLLPPLPAGWVISALEQTGTQWFVVILGKEQGDKLAYAAQVDGAGWSPHAAMVDALQKIKP